MKLTRQAITDAWHERLSGLNHGYWITLNGKERIQNHGNSQEIYKIDRFEAKVNNYLFKLNEFCFGRRFLRGEAGAKLLCLVGYEIGDEDGLVHAHVLGLHDGCTNRTTDDVSLFSQRKWSWHYDMSGSTRFVEVLDAGITRSRIWYMTKQSEKFQYQYGESNIAIV